MSHQILRNHVAAPEEPSSLLHFPKCGHLQPLPNKPFISDAVNWSLCREAVPGLDIMGAHCFMGLETGGSSSRKRFLSQAATPRKNSTQFVANSVRVIPEQQIGQKFSFGTYNGASGDQILTNSGVPVLTSGNLSHNTIRQLAALRYLQSPPSKYDTITCTVRESESVVGERGGEVLEQIEEGWAQPVIYGNEREVKRQAYALLAQLERFSLAAAGNVQNLATDSKGSSKKRQRKWEADAPSRGFRKLNMNKRQAVKTPIELGRQE